jgi:hypothetical protein
MNSTIIIIVIFLLLTLYIKWKAPYLTGRIGERFVNKKLFQLDQARYKFLDNLLLPSRGHLKNTQIDHVVVSDYGIFCIETKAYKGWIFGNASQEYWTQAIYRHKERFYNPLRQNYAHVKAIEELILSRYPQAKIISLVAFPYANKLKISGTDTVGYARDVVRKIEGYTATIFSDIERDEIYTILTRANIQDNETRKIHDKGVRELSRK